MNADSKLSQAVIDLHNIARLIETSVGTGQLSMDIRDCADRLHNITQPLSAQEK
jgi:hypothetical protein